MKDKGFTLIELMIVIAIIAIIAAIAIPNLREAQRNANEAAAVTSLRQYLGAQGTYHRTDYDQDGVKEYAADSRCLFDWDLDDGNNDDPTSIGFAIKLVDLAFARAIHEGNSGIDDASYPGIFGNAARPRSGYYFADHVTDENGDAFIEHDDDDVPVGYTNGFGLSAFPARYNRTGIKCFVINDQGTVYERIIEGLERDTEDDLPLAFPADLDGEGWILTGE
ncbi:MAG TPA: DUF2950 family protein [Planctomycetes bacterium]|nr:DUF2950 family protein [Planctomycetota bacterium]